MSGEYIGVYILDVPYHADCEYTYFVPFELREDIEKGTAVVVPFGPSNRKKSAIVVSCDVKPQRGAAIKPVFSVLSGYFKLSEEMIELCAFMKRQTLCTVGEAVKCVIPTFAIAKTKETFTVLKNTDKPTPLYEYINQNPGVDLKRLQGKFEDTQREIKRLLRLGLIQKNTVVEEKDKSKYETRVFLLVDKDEALEIAEGKGKTKLRGKKQGEILRLLCEYKELSDKEIYQMASTLKSSLDTLVKKGLVGTKKIEILRNQYSNKAEKRENVVLSREQEDAFNTLKALLGEDAPRAALLYGVTGSGKTSVIKKMIDEAIGGNKSVIVLVPEISLTPQTVDTFCGYYGERVAVVHSNLSSGERFDTYKRIWDGKADIVIGTRSAVFAPVKNLGMIVIDEEQEHTYKSDTNPKYSAHDIARFRCAKSGALMLLASATPSLNSYYKAKSGAYTLVKLTKRYGDAVLPDVIITDMRKERARGNMGAFGTKLTEYMGRTLDDKRQAILFLNRRGYHSSVSCNECGKAVECPNCSVALTYHSYRKISEELDANNTQRVMEKSGVLKCHYCGYRIPVPQSCPSCKEGGLEYVGFGTQKTEQDLEKLFPGTSVLRLDADTTTSKLSYEEILGAFRNKEADVLIGTQMVTKGHNFPLVTLVGVVMADTMLYTSDYRAAERTFSMLTQVIGRAGRAKDHGVAIIQTNSPNDQAILLSAKQDYDSFYENEIQIRRAYEFPPFCDIAVLTVSCQNEVILNKNSDMLIKKLEKEITALGVPVKAYGPFEAPIYKSNGRYRKRIILKCKLNNSLRQALSKIYIEFTRASDKNFLSIDFNPSNL
ncbi:MAG: primosomal protein N' [Ruminococcaceae bacterium]|nr:primosomal protein N' [Oscillospiraceae bacterium]